MSTAKLPWFRAYTRMVDDDKLKLLAFEDRWHFVALLCLKGEGLLDKGDTPSLLMRKVAVKLGLDVRSLATLLNECITPRYDHHGRYLLQHTSYSRRSIYPMQVGSAHVCVVDDFGFLLPVYAIAPDWMAS